MEEKQIKKVHRFLTWYELPDVKHYILGKAKPWSSERLSGVICIPENGKLKVAESWG
jgi:hypothetical protein